MKYPREAIVAAIGADHGQEFRPIDDLLSERGVHPYIARLAIDLGVTLSEQYSAQGLSDPEVIECVGEIGFLRGFLVGLTLAENEQQVQKAVEAFAAEQSPTHFTRDRLPDAAEFHLFFKTGTTRLARVNGPFSVETKEGLVTCDDGWLALDVDNDPYPVADEVFRKSYAPLT